MRGEYSWGSAGVITKAELPPRARRIPQLIGRWRGGKGTTSACAGNTCTGSGRSCTPQNYLRVRGEYITGQSRLVNYSELPPRARRIRPRSGKLIVTIGTTSACAENTFFTQTETGKRLNYLRVRGEYAPRTPIGVFLAELPPRARRIRRPPVRSWPLLGTTSACAENTPCSTSVGSGMWNYLRVRGEYRDWKIGTFSHEELPPRARRIPLLPLFGALGGGTTSACAENT